MPEYTITIDPERRRVRMPLPFPMTGLAEDSPAAAAVKAVCGEDAEVDFLVGNRIGCVAIHAKGDTSWRRELGLEVAGV